MISESYAERIRKYIQEAERNPDILNTQKILPADYRAMGTAAQLFTESLLIGLDSALQKKQFAEIDIEDIENLPYEEAVEYLSKRSVLKKSDYYDLSDKLRFRAFTVGRINDGRLLEKLNSEMIKNVNDGKGLKDFLSLTKTDILNKIGMGPNQGWYWETVYRTNVQTAYNVGRAMGFEEDHPIALEFVGIDDARQTETCSSLSGTIRPYDDPFWETHTPPMHFNCRSTLRGIYDEAELPEKWSPVADAEEAAKGFGRWPTENNSWWEELASQTKAAKYYGIQQEIEAAREILVEGVQEINRTSEQKETLKYVKKMKKMPFFTEDIKAEDREQVFDDLKKIQPKHAKLLAKYLGKMRGDFYSNRNTAAYNSDTNTINLNIKNSDVRSTVRGFITDFKSFLHESGHWLDENALGNGKTIRSQLPELKNLLEKDLIAYCDRILPAENQIKKLEELFDIVSLDNRKKLIEDLSIDKDLKCGIQDIVSGLTRNGLKLKYNHAYPYWLKFGIEQETIAHFFEAYGSGGTTERYIQEIFPSAYKYFTSYIGGLE